MQYFSRPDATAIAVGNMINHDEKLQADRFFHAARGLDRGWLGNGHQNTLVLGRCDELRGTME